MSWHDVISTKYNVFVCPSQHLFNMSYKNEAAETKGTLTTNKSKRNCKRHSSIKNVLKDKKKVSKKKPHKKNERKTEQH